jgi:hypothetical protein
MRLIPKVLLTVLVVAVLVVAYLAITGYGSPVDDFDGDSDGEGDVPDSETLAYASFEVKTSAWGYPRDSEFTKIDGYVLGITAKVEPYESPDEGRVYEGDIWDILSPVPPSPADVVGETWIVVKVTGPDGYSTTWTSTKTPLLSTDNEPCYTIYLTGRTFFSDGGVYTAKASLYGTLFDVAWANQLIMEKSLTFEVKI